MVGSQLVQVVAAAAALALAAVFVYAGVAKVRRRPETAADFASMGLPKPERLAVMVPMIELLTAAILVVLPGWGGVLAAALLIGFTTNLFMVIRSGRVATCACFGGASTEPVSASHLIRNAGLGVLAIAAALFEGWIWQVF